MAWQNSGAMVGNGGASGPNGDGVNGAQSQGTEYTLQGLNPRPLSGTIGEVGLSLTDLFN
jgi:hypothetical protein